MRGGVDTKPAAARQLALAGAAGCRGSLWASRPATQVNAKALGCSMSNDPKTRFDHAILPTAFPPDSGILQFTVAGPPVSAQARLKSRKAEVRQKILGLFRSLGYLLSGEVHVDIEWLIHEKERYETDTAPDIDAILKPLLDAISGPEALLIDDSQVQSVACRWLDHAHQEQCLKFEIRFRADEWVSKKDLFFVHFGDNLCFPMDRSTDIEWALRCVEMVQRMVDTRREIQAKSGDYYVARLMMPAQRMFHRTRVSQHFSVVEASTYLADLKVRHAT